MPRAEAATSAYAPAQFIAKQYTEALGRIPDQPGWQAAIGWFGQAGGCNAGNLATEGETMFTSAEFNALGYSNAARILALYRGSVNREPDQAGFTNWMNQLASGLSWATVVQKFYTGGEFATLVSQICSGVVDGSGSSYHFGTQPAIALPTSGSGFTGVAGHPNDSQSALQSLLDATASAGGGTVVLAQQAVVWLTSTLTVPSGVTLTTQGAPDPRHYAEMGRLVRRSAFNDKLVVVKQGGALRNVWVDGARGNPGNEDPSRINVVTYGGPDTVVTANRISDSQGAQNLYLFGDFNGYTCPSTTASDNLITAYASDNYQANTWTDGIADDCEGATVTGNQIIDSTDVAIVLYRTTSHPQHSVVRNNSVLSAGNSMYGGIGLDPLFRAAGQAPATWDFTGATIEGNTLWTGPDTHFVIGIPVGTRAWFATVYTSDTGTGGSVTGNTTGSLSARVVTGVAVSGMVGTTVTGNKLSFVHNVHTGSCPAVDYAADIRGGHASGTFSPTPLDTNLDGCL
ncbi:DUF4214 domain-containing protein [Rugosimonospora africana]|nr:DUF4214 domain-containing protein [Rugosimonospora africana]